MMQQMAMAAAAALETALQVNKHNEENWSAWKMLASLSFRECPSPPLERPPLLPTENG